MRARTPRSRHLPPTSPASPVLSGLSCGLLSWALLSCGGSQSKSELPPEKAAPLKKSPAAVEAETRGEKEQNASGLPWAERTYSPQPGSTPEPDLERAESACGKGDAALHEVARLVSELHAKEGEAPSLDVTKFHLRRMGTPYVMPRLWTAAMNEVDEEAVAKSVESWAQARPPLGEFRCGLGSAKTESGSYVVTGIQVDVLAEVQPIPTRVDSGTWLDFEATLLAPTSAATVLLLPPEGRPKQLQTKLDGQKARARFPIETEGTWLVQLMATQTGGPRPVAQMLVTADREPPAGLDVRPVPGEKAFNEKLQGDDALFSLMNAAREDQGLPSVKRNRKLDRLAQEHCRAMIEQGRISHDTGAGHPAHRIELAGLRPKATGENVALAGNVVRLHRVLWASPAHRENLLLRRWDEAGVGVVEGEDGSLYATQLFIDSD